MQYGADFLRARSLGIFCRVPLGVCDSTLVCVEGVQDLFAWCSRLKVGGAPRCIFFSCPAARDARCREDHPSFAGSCSCSALHVLVSPPKVLEVALKYEGHHGTEGTLVHGGAVQ